MRTIKTNQCRATVVAIMFFSLVFAIIVPTAFAQETDLSDVYGIWHTGDATIEIRDCGNESPCGYIVKVDAQRSNIDPLLDRNNPDHSQRKNTLVGTRLLYSFTEKKGRWRKGRIYNPENGKSYTASLKLKPPTTLEVKGCIGPFCQKQLWVRDMGSFQRESGHAEN